MPRALDSPNPSVFSEEGHHPGSGFQYRWLTQQKQGFSPLRAQRLCIGSEEESPRQQARAFVGRVTSESDQSN